jgi:hypothetical protein
MLGAGCSGCRRTFGADAGLHSNYLSSRRAESPEDSILPDAAAARFFFPTARPGRAVHKLPHAPGVVDAGAHTDFWTYSADLRGALAAYGQAAMPRPPAVAGSFSCPTLPTWVVQQVGRYLRYTRCNANVAGKVAPDPMRQCAAPSNTAAFWGRADRLALARRE